VDRRIQSTIEYIEVHFQQRVPVRVLARSVNTSYWHFCRLFRSEVGFSPGEYHKFVKLRHAKDLLEKTFMSVKEIAGMVGMDESHFVREFRERNGCTPRRYRRECVSRRDRAA